MNLFHFIALWFKSDVSIQVNVTCFIWLQLQMSFVVSRCASWIILMILFKSQLFFIPLLSFSLWNKQESHFSSFLCGILVEAFWLAETSWKLLLLVSPRTFLFLKCVLIVFCFCFLALSFMHSVSLMLLNTLKAASLGTSAINLNISLLSAPGSDTSFTQTNTIPKTIPTLYPPSMLYSCTTKYLSLLLLPSDSTVKIHNKLWSST